MVGAARCYSMLFDGDQKRGESNRPFLFLRYCCLLLGEMLDSLDHSFELSLLAHAQLTLFTFNVTSKFRILWGAAQEPRRV